MSFTAIVANDTIKLPMHVPDGTRVEITLPENASEVEGGSSLFDLLQGIIGKVEGLPVDFAAEHDHYLHGAPKRAQP